MEVKGAETPGAGLTDAVRLLLELPTERLLSLTYLLGPTPEEDIVHALSLLFLNRETQGLDRLQALQDNSLANHLAEKWHTAGGKSEDFREQCGRLDGVAAVGGTLEHLARVFKVLVEKGLCEPQLRDLAYRRAVSAYGEKENQSKVQLMIDEAKNVCGPQFAEKMSLQMHPQSVGEADGESTGLSLMQGKPEGNLSMPCSLQASASLASYPTHLEISLPPTTVVISDQITPVKSQHSHPSTAPQSLGEDDLQSNAPGSYLSSNSSEASSTLTSENVSSTTPCSIATTHASSPEEDEKQTTTTPSARSKAPPATPESCTPKIPVPIKTDTGKETEEEEEVDTFYAFVILHAAEDVDSAEAMKERLESICGGSLEGATFSEDFVLPGRSSLRCIDDAIDNSAFTFLLLTNHFHHSRHFQVETESALLNSIEHSPKYNTVIPLLPRDNGMARDALPAVLRILVPLEDNSRFDRKIKKLLSPESLRAQRSLWSDEQEVKKARRRLDRMKGADRQRKLLSDVRAATAKSELERVRIYMETSLHMQRDLQSMQNLLSSPGEGASLFPRPGPGWPHQQPANIHVENAKYIMIGNDSKMTVDLGGSNTERVDKDD
ncbi:unnamed protein product [Lota lota]